MAGTIGNRNAEKYSRDDVLSLMEEAIKKIRSGEYLFKYDALLGIGVSEALLSYWKRDRFKNDETVLESIKEFESFSKMALFSGALQNKLNSTTAIFIGKSVHGMVEQGEADKTEALKRVVTTQVIAPTGMDKRIDEIRKEVKKKSNG